MTMTPPTPIETFEDILAALERNPQLRAAMRQHILDQEFLQLPTIVRELQQAVTQLTQVVHDYIAATDARLGQIETRLDRIEVRLDGVEVRLDKIETDVTEIKGQQTTMSGQITIMSGHIANLASSDYESRAIEQSRRMVRGRLEMVKATVIHASRWDAQTFEENLLLPAITEGRITRHQADQLEEADSIIRCEDQDGSVVHAVVEISVTVQDTDRQSAHDRTTIAAAATGTRAEAFVVGQKQEQRREGVPDVTFLEYAG